MRHETIAIHGGYDRDPVSKSVAVPIYQTVAYAFDSADHAAALFNLEVEGNIYSRIGNPTNNVLEKRIAALEGGVGALTVGCGAAAVDYAISTVTETGANIVSVPQLYGATYTLFAHILPRRGVATRFANSDQPEDIEPLIDADTRAVYCESVGNPAGNVADIAALAACAHRHGVPLIVDNTVATPILLRPIEHGADIVLHSLTKFIGGHGTTLGGILVDSGRFDWKANAARFPMMSTPEPSYHDVVYTDHYKEAAYIGRARTVCQRNTGSVLAPLSAFLLLQGLETLPLRIARHVENARLVAAHLRADPRIAWVNHASFPDNPYHGLVVRYLGGQAPSIMTFGLAGGFAAGKRFFDALRLFTRLVNMGDAKSLVTHPASTTHRQLTPAEQARAGVSPEMIRFSVGIEHIDDLLEDIDQALDAARGRR